MSYSQEEQLGQLKSELVALKRELAAGEKKLQVFHHLVVSALRIAVAYFGLGRRGWKNKSRN